MEKLEINLEDEKEYEYEARLPKKRHRCELVFKNFVQPIEGVEKIEDLIKRVKTYFRFTPNKLMISHKGLVYIFDETKWPKAYKRFSDKKMEKLKEQRLKNNQDFFECYLKAIANERKKPLKVKIFENEEDKCDEDLIKEDSVFNPSKDSQRLSKKKAKKIKFTYLTNVIEDLKIKFDEIKELADLINFLNDKLLEKFKKNKNLVKKKQLIYEPVSLFIVNNYGKLTKIKHLSHLFDIVRSFEDRRYIYFNIMPFFGTKDKKKKVHIRDEVNPDEVVNQRPVHQNSHEENFDQNFLVDFISTLDDVSKDQVNMVLSVCPNHNPKEIYDMIRQYNGDCDPVIDKLLEMNSKE